MGERGIFRGEPKRKICFFYFFFAVKIISSTDGAEVAMEKITADTVVSSSELAVLFGRTTRRIQQLTQDGILSTDSKGKYNLKDAIEAWVEQNSGDSGDELTRAKADRALHEVRLKKAKADMEELRAKELSGTMHRAEDVRAITEDMIFAIRSALNALPGRVSVDVHACGSAAEVSALLTKEVHKIMKELAGYRYDPEKYAERVREREKWLAEYGPEDEDE